jgi:hypothetical protein
MRSGGKTERGSADVPVTSLSPRDECEECGADLATVDEASHCPACFDRKLYGLDAGFLESYRRFGVRGRLVVAETCLRALTLESPDHRKILAMTIFEQYVLAVTDLAALFSALRNRERAPILRSFLDFRLEPAAALEFFAGVQEASNAELLGAIGLPHPAYIADLCPHLEAEDAAELGASLGDLVRDLRRATDKGAAGALLLAEVAGNMAGAVIAQDTSWLEGASTNLTPDQVAMFALDSCRRSLHVQGISAEERPLAEVIDAIDTVTRAASNLVYAYLQTNDL